MMHSISLHIVLIADFILSFAGKIIALRMENQLCKPRPVVIAMDPEQHRYFPLFIELYRCNGSINKLPPSQQQCVIIDKQDLLVDAVIRDSYTKADGRRAIALKQYNVTACGPGCVIKPGDCSRWQKFDQKSCKCACPHTYPPTACDKLRRWSPISCTCECRISEKCRNPQAEWSATKCGCVCSERKRKRCALNHRRKWNKYTCSCEKTDASTETITNNRIVNNGDALQDQLKRKSGFLGTQNFWYCVVVAEFVLLTVIFDLILYRKRSGILFLLAHCCKAKEYPIETSLNTSNTQLTACEGMEDVD